MEGNHSQGVPSAARVEACEGGGSKRPPSSRSPDDGERNWTANGEATKSTQTVRKNSDHYAISDRNKHASNSSSIDMPANLPGELTTPPLTPPREQPPPPTTSEPVNGNRNNMSDSVHANSANFKTTKQLELGMGMAKDAVRKQLAEASEVLKRTNGTPPPRVDATPPALVVISEDRKRGRVEEAESENAPMVDKPGEDSREATPPNNRRPYNSQGEVGSLQSMQVTSAGGGDRSKDQLSSEDEEMEDVELVLVEDGGEEETSRQKDSTAVEIKPVDGMGSRDVGTNMRDDFVGLSSSHAKRRRPPESVVMNGSKEPTHNGHSSAAHHDKKPSPELASPSQGGGDRFHRRNKGDASVVRAVHTTGAKQAAKLKQFFTTIQQRANELGNEVAEQVQELIHALMNETATVEEFHQEIQMIMNYPLKDFIIPFLRESVHYFRAELKESSQVLTDVLGSGEIPTTSTAVTLTPQLVDDELPVLSSSTSKHRTISSSSLNSAPKTIPSSSSSVRTSIPHSNSTTNHVHGTGSNVQLHSHHGAGNPGQHGIGTGGHSYSSSGGEEVDQHRHLGRQQVRTTTTTTTTAGGVSTIGGMKRRRWSGEQQGTSVVSVDKDKEIAQEKIMPKRIRTDDGTVIITTPRPPPPSYHHAPPPPPVTHLVAVSQPPSSSESHGNYVSITQDHAQRRHGRGIVLSEDWGHIDMMLTSVQGMLEKTRQSVAVLKERVTTIHIEMERREHERETIIQQRVGEAVDKIHQKSNEEKQRLLLDASRQMREAVSMAKDELENKFQQAQSLAVQEALKENNTQSSSKEHCWNCGRRATETCSGCNKARYCGTFCQHKDWANHMHHCASGVQQEEVSRESKRIMHAPMSAGEVARASSNRGVPVGASQQHHRTVAIPVNLISPQEVNLRMARPHQDILIKTERT